MSTSSDNQDSHSPDRTAQAALRTRSSSQEPAKPASGSTQVKNEDAAAKSKPASKLPAWIIDNITSARSLRILARCWVATWANFVLMIPGPSLRVLGQAAFFGSMLTLMIPPSMPFFIFLLAFGMIAIGSLLGWAWGCAAMAAADRARSRALLQAAVQKVRSSAATATNPEAYVTTSVFRGAYLDVRSTAVFGVFLIVGVYFCAVVQVKLPKLKIASIFLLIVLDIMTTYGPLFPYPRYTLGEIFMIPIGCSFAICLASQMLIFPETLSHSWQLRFISMLTTTRDLVSLHASALSDASKHHGPESEPSAQAHHDQPSGDFLQQSLKAEDEAAKTAAGLLAKVKGNRAAVAQQIEDINGMTAFLGMEFYRSYFSAHDMKLIFRKTRSVNLQLTLLNSFWRLIHHELELADPNTFDESWDPSKVEEGYDVDGEHGTEALPTKERLKPIRLHETHTIHRVRRDIFKSEAQQQVTMARMLSILNRVAQPSLEAASESLGAVQGYFEANVSWRQKRPIDQVLHQLHETKTKLESARQGLLNDKRLELLQPYAEHFRATHPDLDLEQHFLQTRESIRTFRAGVRPLHVCLVFVTNLIDVLESVSQLHSEMLSVADRAGGKKRIWWPKHLGRLVSILRSDKRGSSDGLDGLGPGDTQFEREQDIDRDFREDRAHTASSINDADTLTVADHLEAESDSDDEENSSQRSSSSRSPRPRDEEKASAIAKDDSKKGSKRAKGGRKHRYYPRDPDALPPTSIVHRIGRGVAATYYFVSGPTGMFALRMCIATFAVWITAVLPNTAYFVYQHRGIWALIMAQTAAALSGGELIFTFAMRLGGTVVGLLYGAVLWYISTGRGNGNPYGIGATTAVGFIPLVFMRVWAPKLLLLPVIMLNVSVILIVGYSWIDTHLQVLANSGIGIEVAWRRTLLVIIGMAVALIVMIFPRPVSSRLLLRKNMAKVTRQLNDMFVDVMECWIARNRIFEQEFERASFANQIDAHREKEASSQDAVNRLWQERYPVIRARFMAVNARIATYPMQIGLASMDFHIRGRWPAERYAEIASVHATIIESLGAIFSSVRAFDGYVISSPGDVSENKSSITTARHTRDWQRMLVSTTSLLDPQYLSEICVIFDLLSKALRNGERLNHASFSLLENHFKYASRNRTVDAFLRQKAAEQQGQAGVGGELATQGEDVISWGVLRDPMYLRYTTARMASITLAAELDKFKAIVQDLVGESSLRGFDMLKEKHDNRMYRAAAASSL